VDLWMRRAFIRLRGSPEKLLRHDQFQAKNAKKSGINEEKCASFALKSTCLDKKCIVLEKSLSWIFACNIVVTHCYLLSCVSVGLLVLVLE